MRNGFQQIQFRGDLISPVVVEYNESVYRIIYAVEQPVNPMRCVNTSRTDNRYRGRGFIQIPNEAATMLTLDQTL